MNAFSWIKDRFAKPAAPAQPAIPDYYGDAFTVLHEDLSWMKEPVFSHPVTGEKLSAHAAP